VVRIMRDLDSNLADPEIWEEGDDRMLDDQVIRYARQVAGEDRNAAALLERPFQNASTFVFADVGAKPRYRTAGVVRALCRKADAVCEEDPLFAVALADHAVVIAEALTAAFYPPEALHQLIGAAWKERADACRFLGRFPEALAALDHAERAFRRLVAGGHELARVNYSRATVLLFSDRLDEAMPIVTGLAETFALYGDEERYLNAKLLEGLLSYRRKDLARAANVWSALRDRALESGMAPLAARLAMNVGCMYLERGDSAEASRWFHDSFVEFRSLGMHTEVIRVQWQQARVVAAAGKPGLGIEKLRTAGQAFAARGMALDAALVELDVVEALILVGRNSEAQRLSRRLFRTFRSAGLATGALTALAYLKEVATARPPAVLEVTYVREVLERARDVPSLVFARPDSET